jgi:hypothetical protein
METYTSSCISHHHKRHYHSNGTALGQGCIKLKGMFAPPIEVLAFTPQ